jgi:hypothetical protein
MKTTTASRFPAVATALAILITCGFSIRPAQAIYIVSLQQVGPDVVATGSGTIDLNGLSFVTNGAGVGSLFPLIGEIATGLDNSSFYDYTGFSGPSSFGAGPPTGDSSGSGDYVGIIGASNDLRVPRNYVSGTPLSDAATYSGYTLATLGVTPGIYTWTWGTGVHADSFTLYAGVPVPGVPDSGSTFGLLIVALVGLFGISRLRARQLA